MRAHCLRYWIALGVSLLLCTGRVAWAQTAADKAAADTLFEEGRRLIAKGDTAAACAKFEASLSKLIQLGAQLALATCYEKVGMIASSWAMFRAAASTASKAHDKRRPFAEDRATAMEARLSRLAVTIDPGNRVDGLVVKRDGVALAPAELGTPVPVDPGVHTIESSAPGHVGWSITVSILPAPGVVDVPVPQLAKVPEKAVDKPVVAVVPTVQVEPGDGQRKRRIVAYSLVGGGVAAVGVSLVFGALARSRWNAAQSHCNHGLCDQTGFDRAGSAHTMGTISTAAFVVGAGAVVAGAVVLLTAPSQERPPRTNSAALRIIPSIGAAQVGLAMQGGF